MSDKPAEPEKNEARPNLAMPGGAAKLYSRAGAPGTRYEGFSASRRQVQEQLRERIAREHAQRPGAGNAAPPSQVLHMREFARKHNFAPAPRPPVLSPSEQAASRRHARQPLVAAGEAVTALPPGFAQRPPSVAVFSLAAGVGKTCLTATLGRALSALGEQVLLVDTAPAGSLPPYFGASKGRPGVVRTFSPNPFSPSGLVGLENRKNMQLLNLEAERFPLLESGQDWMLGKLVHEGRGLSRLLIDIATAGPELRRLLLLRPVILVPMLPELEAIAGLDSIESLLSQPAPDGGEAQVFFVLNQFDVASAQHQQVRDMLQAQLGDRLLPWVIHRSAAVSEALAESMTVMDYAPDSPAAEDYRELAAWLHQH